MTGVIGGTGNLGSGLALRWVIAGRGVIIGSRTADKATHHAEELRKTAITRGAAARDIRGADNAGAASAAKVVLLAVPFESARHLAADRPAFVGKDTHRCHGTVAACLGHPRRLPFHRDCASGFLPQCHRRCCGVENRRRGARPLQARRIIEKWTLSGNRRRRRRMSESMGYRLKRLCPR